MSELFRLAGIVPFDPVPDRLSVTGITESTTELKAGMLFVAREGTTFDGHDFLNIAAAKGAFLLRSINGFWEGKKRRFSDYKKSENR